MAAKWLKDYSQTQNNFKNPDAGEVEVPVWQGSSDWENFEDSELITTGKVTDSSLIQNPSNWTNTWNNVKISRTGLDWSFVDFPGICTIKVSFTNDIMSNHKKGYDYTTLHHAGANSKTISLNVQMNGYDYQIYKDNIMQMMPIAVLDKADDCIIYLQNELLFNNCIDRVLLESAEQSTPEKGMFVLDFNFIEYKIPIFREEIKDNVKLNIDGSLPSAVKAAPYNPDAASLAKRGGATGEW